MCAKEGACKGGCVGRRACGKEGTLEGGCVGWRVGQNTSEHITKQVMHSKGVYLF